jgi:DNA mismatch repair protein MutS
MMRQYYSIKKEHPNTILFFRMGDFYETFEDDAKVVARELNIALTSRSHGKGASRIPLAGIPYHALDAYLSKMVKKGHKVAICEQVEDPKLAKGLVKREVVRVVTPGTVMEDSLLEADSNNYLAAIHCANCKIGLSFVDISTGEFLVTEFSGEDAVQRTISELSRFQPKEAVVPEGWNEPHLWEALRAMDVAITEYEGYAFDDTNAKDALKTFFKVHSLDGLGFSEGSASVSSSGAVISYLMETQKGSLPGISSITPYSTSDFMVLDSITLRNLEIVQNVRDRGKKYTLLWVLDRTKSPMGSRLIRKWLQQPLLDIKEINKRLDAVECLAGDRFLRTELAGLLKQMRDMERIIGRVGYGSANARDLLALKECFETLPEIKKMAGKLKPSLFRKTKDQIGNFSTLAKEIDKAIVESPPVSLKEGGIIRDGYDKELDSIKSIVRDNKAWISELQVQERKTTGISSLKVKFNKVFGYYIEVTTPNLHLVPEGYTRKQTMANAERFITPELKERETIILTSEEKTNGLEHELFCSLRSKVGENGEVIKAAAGAVAVLDVLLSLADCAVDLDYCRPGVDGSSTIQIEGGRHPVVERVVEGSYIPNSCTLDEKDNRMIILTGPNMAGKSTYMRQVALIALTAQVGSFVPAAAARIGVVDRIFTRVGAYDDLTRGQSTFMVEMTELANILNSVTRKSLVILDEIGRGTSTFDGLSIAWAVTEYLYDTKVAGAKTIFATHYHQLTEIADFLDGVKNYNILVKEKNNDIVFLREVVPGGTNKSYGIQVARLAGVPTDVVTRAHQVLGKLEEENVLEVKKSVGKKWQATLPVFLDKSQAEIEDALKQMDVNNMTPMEAMQRLHDLKKKADSDGGGE